MTLEQTPDVRKRLDAHLDAVEHALNAAGRSREQRRGIVDDLEAQILDMLANRSAAPSLTDLDSVLATLDPPAAYDEPTANVSIAAPATPASIMQKSRFSRPALWGFSCILASLLPIPFLMLLGFIWMSAATVTRPLSARDSTPPSLLASGGIPVIQTATASTTPTWTPQADTETYRFNRLFDIAPYVGALLATLAILGTLLGWIAVAQIRRSAGTLRGKGLAIFDQLFYPCLLGLSLVLALLHDLLLMPGARTHY